jgi:hypothetical protein
LPRLAGARHVEQREMVKIHAMPRPAERCRAKHCRAMASLGAIV